MRINEITGRTRRYNLHSHTQFCDGHAAMDEMAAAALACGMEVYGFTPHSPVPVVSPCNMTRESVSQYLDEAERLRGLYDGRMLVLRGMEIDGLGADWGPHVDYFQRLPLDYRIGSVHFVPTRDGVPVDCDGSFGRFSGNLRQAYGGDLRYVVEKYFERVLLMQERGGFELLGHFDKIIANAAQADPELEDQGWYSALIDDVISHAQSAGTVVEVNTKAWAQTGRFFPAERWWPRLLAAGVPLAVNSDAHWPDKIDAGREEAHKMLDKLIQ